MAEHQERPTITVSVAFVADGETFWREFRVPPGTTVIEAVERSGVLQRFPDWDLDSLKLGIFAKPVKADRPLEDGDRIELCRPLRATTQDAHNETGDSG